MCKVEEDWWYKAWKKRNRRAVEHSTGRSVVQSLKRGEKTNTERRLVHNYKRGKQRSKVQRDLWYKALKEGNRGAKYRETFGTKP